MLLLLPFAIVWSVQSRTADGAPLDGGPLLAWTVVLGFIRLVTHPSVLEDPLMPEVALDRVDEWFAGENVTILEPGPRHLRIVRDLFAATGVAGSLTTDTHLAALAIEHSVELHSNDRDFERFPGLRLFNPIA